MSEPGPPPLPPSSQPGGCGTALMLLFGVILLLPGLCAILFLVGSVTTGGADSTLVGLGVLGLMLGAIGVMLLYTAVKGRGR
ncbi:MULTISPECIES: hypothetical protein [Bradyrhizobium]|uniref:hypothetical protein n=1 Tax=Bradyrhizobium TaxID=374 RepID=UPI0010B2806C|nr:MULTISPECIES: hypothetical protein [Bradyrhizobium]QOZ22464.1 hypothetical protein XH93_01465 [Bradyrhizobium sp. CCBAU 51753]VIO66839.1 hypothetical protein CI41S_01950 [Bradyrhizobium ivorense]